MSSFDRHRNERGTAFVETVIAIPIFALLLVLIFDYTQLFNKHSQMASIGREAALRGYRECVLATSLDATPPDAADRFDVRACLQNLVTEFQTSYFPNGAPPDTEIIISVYFSVAGSTDVEQVGSVALSRYDVARVDADPDLASALLDGSVTIAEITAPYKGTLIGNRQIYDTSVF